MGADIFERHHLFTPAECAAVRLLAKGDRGRPAPVYGTDRGKVDAAMRRASVHLLERGGTVDWVFDRLDALFAAAGKVLGIEVEQLFEPVQLVCYGPGDHFVMWHSDAGLDRIDERRLSASIELSEPKDYAGGRLEIAPGRMLPTAAPEQGHATVFPSRMLHRVTPVTCGERYALVAWTGLNSV